MFNQTKIIPINLFSPSLLDPFQHQQAPKLHPPAEDVMNIFRALFPR